MLEKIFENSGAYIAAIFGGGAIGTVITALLSRRKTSAEAESTLSNAIMGFVKILQAEIGTLQTQVTRTQGDLSDAQARLLSAQKKVNELEDIVRRAEEEKQDDKNLITQLVEALRKYEPNSPLLVS